MRALQLGIATGVAGVAVAVGLLGPAIGAPTRAEVPPVSSAQVDVSYDDSGFGGSGYAGFGDGYGYGYGTYDSADEYCEYYCE